MTRIGLHDRGAHRFLSTRLEKIVKIFAFWRRGDGNRKATLAQFRNRPTDLPIRLAARQITVAGNNDRDPIRHRG